MPTRLQASKEYLDLKAENFELIRHPDIIAPLLGFEGVLEGFQEALKLSGRVSWEHQEGLNLRNETLPGGICRAGCTLGP